MLLSSREALAYAPHFCGAVNAMLGLEILANHRAWFGSRAMFKGQLGNGQLVGLGVMAQVVAGILCAISGHAELLLICSVGIYLTAVRFGGTYNGGSDSMLLITSLGLGLSAVMAPSPFARIPLLWIVAHTLLSYGVAGAVKLRHREWWTGTAITRMSGLHKYRVPAWAVWAFSNRGIAALLGWVVMIFEVGLPIAALFRNDRILTIGLVAGLLFHFSNFLLLGLNRFFWAWTSAYLVVWGVLGGPK